MDLIEPLNHHLIVKLIDLPEKTKGGIILPQRTRKNTVLPYGEIRYVCENAEPTYGWCVGQHIYFHVDTILYVLVHGEEFIAVDEREVVCRVDPMPQGVPADYDG